MNGLLDTILVLTFILCGLSLVTSALCEAVVTLTRLRGLLLMRAIREMLVDESVVTFAAFCAHPTIKAQRPASHAVYALPVALYTWIARGLRGTTLGIRFLVTRSAPTWQSIATWRPPLMALGWPRVPSYLPASVFSSVVLDLMLSRKDPKITDLNELKTQLSGAKGSLSATIREALHDGALAYPALRTQVGEYYDRSMERCTGWFRRRVWVFNVVIGFGLALALNADLWSITALLEAQPELRTKAAVAIAAEIEPATPKAKNGTEPQTPKPAAAATASGAPDLAALQSQLQDATAAGDEARVAQIEAQIEATNASPGPTTTESPDKSGGGQPAGAANGTTTLPDQEAIEQAWVSLWSERLVPLGWSLSGPGSAKYGTTFKERFPMSQAEWRKQKPKLFRLALTALLLGLGAPFWFDLVGRITAVRSGKQPAPTTIPGQVT